MKHFTRLFFRYKKEDSAKQLDLSIPFIFTISLNKFYSWQGRITIRILIFTFTIALYYGLGWSVRQNFNKWRWSLVVHLKRLYVAFHIGISETNVLIWKIRRAKRKLGIPPGYLLKP